MKTYRQREKQGSKVQESTKGPNEAKIKALLERTGYTLDVTTGQRKYRGPPPDSVYSGIGGYEDPYDGYDDGCAVRGRGGGRGGRGAPAPPRGRRAPPPRGRAGYSQRGPPLGPPRGSRGGRGGPAQ
uniref:Uncharacterized protein n=1 Tax=Monodon monoceros TaxID=40151 RepID=A0A8C6F6U9_MONMO